MPLNTLTHWQAGQFLRYCWICYGIVWILASLSSKRTVAEWSPASRIGYLASWVGVYMLMFRATWWTSPLLVGRGPAASLAVCILCVVGLLIAFWARYALGRNWSGNVTLKENHELVDTGPYQFVRHPIYTGLLLMWVACALFQGTPVAFLSVAIFLVVHIWKYRQEEDLMRKTFPNSYPGYCGRTKALIPGIF